jgi:hypothetical protein
VNAQASTSSPGCRSGPSRHGVATPAHAVSLPLHDGVTLCLLTAMSLTALLGLRYPVKLLPVLLFESAWKLLWLALVAVPKATTGGLDPATTDTLVSCSGRRHPCRYPGALRVADLRAPHRRPVARTR